MRKAGTQKTGICPRSLNCGVWAGIWRSLTECCPALAQVYRATSQSDGICPQRSIAQLKTLSNSPGAWAVGCVLGRGLGEGDAEQARGASRLSLQPSSQQ